MVKSNWRDACKSNWRDVCKNNWQIAACLMVITLLMISALSVPVFASDPIPGFKMWPGQRTFEATKVWTVTFSDPVSNRTVNNNSVYVTDSKQVRVPTRAALSPDGLTLTVAPSRAYTDGDYNLYITNAIESANGVQLEDSIIMPFTVAIQSIYTPHVELTVTVTDDLRAPYRINGTLMLVENSGRSYTPIGYDSATQKHTFRIFENGEYTLRYIGNTEGVLTTQTLKVGRLTMPAQRRPLEEAKTTRSVSFVVSTRAGVDGGRAGVIGGSTTYTGAPPLGMPGFTPRPGVKVEVSNNNGSQTWETMTDVRGEYRVYLPTGNNYTLVVHGNRSGDKKHTFTKLTVSAGQMTTPLEVINVEDPMGNNGLVLNPPARDASGVLLFTVPSDEILGIREISGRADMGTVVELYNVAPGVNQTRALQTAQVVSDNQTRTDNTGNFTIRLPARTQGMQLELRVKDRFENTYKATMSTPVP